MRVILLALMLGIPLPGDAPAAAEPDTGEPVAHHLLVVIENADDAWEARVNVTTLEGDIVAMRTTKVPARSTARETIEVEPGRYEVKVSREQFGISSVQDTRGCEAAFQVVVELRVGPSILLMPPARAGCLAAPPAALALVEEARAARAAADDPARGILIPLPHTRDEGTLRSWTRLDAPVWDEVSNTSFAWTSNTTFTDEWGREVTGTEVDYDAGGGSCGSGAFVENGPTLRSEVQMEPRGFLRYEAGSKLLGWATPLCSALIGATIPGITSPMKSWTEFTYREQPSFACVFHHDLQGATVDATAGTPGFCGAADMAWSSGAVTTYRDLKALPLYGLHESADEIRVTRAWLAEGVAYPLDLETWRLPTDGPVRRWVDRLVALAPDGEPLEVGTPLPPPADAGLAPLDRFTGPSGAGGIAFPLSEASAAARANLAHGELQTLLSSSDAALVGATYRARQDGPSPAIVDEWTMLFAASDRGTVYAECSRPRTGGGLPELGAPAARCGPVGAFGPRSFGIPEGVGASTLPALAPTFDDAGARWVAAIGAPAGTRPTLAVYQSFTTQFDDAFVRIGRGYPQSNAPLASGDSPDAFWLTLDLESGATRALHTGSQHMGATTLDAVILPLAVGTAQAPASSPSGASVGTIAILGAGVAVVGLLALLAYLWKSALAGLFSRLTRAEVVEGPVRAAILEVVRAEPGIHASGVLERIDKAHGVGEYHLGVLVREGFLTRVVSPGFSRYFVTGRFSHTEMRMLAALKDGQSEKVFRLIEANPGIHVTELAERAGVSLPYASRTVKRLAEAGLVDRVQVGRVVTLHAIER